MKVERGDIQDILGGRNKIVSVPDLKNQLKGISSLWFNEENLGLVIYALTFVQTYAVTPKSGSGMFARYAWEEIYLAIVEYEKQRGEHDKTYIMAAEMNLNVRDKKISLSGPGRSIHFNNSLDLADELNDFMHHGGIMGFTTENGQRTWSYR